MIDDSKAVCVQDEKGIIYVYDLNAEKVEEEVTFSGSGDCEGIAPAGEHAYVFGSNRKIAF